MSEDQPTVDAAEGDQQAQLDPAGDPLLDRAARIADLPLDERPAAFEALNRSLVAELQQLEDA